MICMYNVQPPPLARLTPIPIPLSLIPKFPLVLPQIPDTDGVQMASISSLRATGRGPVRSGFGSLKTDGRATPRQRSACRYGGLQR